MPKGQSWGRSKQPHERPKRVLWRDGGSTQRAEAAGGDSAGTALGVCGSTHCTHPNGLGPGAQPLFRATSAPCGEARSASQSELEGSQVCRSQLGHRPRR